MDYIYVYDTIGEVTNVINHTCGCALSPVELSNCGWKQWRARHLADLAFSELSSLQDSYQSLRGEIIFVHHFPRDGQNPISHFNMTFSSFRLLLESWAASILKPSKSITGDFFGIPMDDLYVGTSFLEQSPPVCILLGGTSGCGKSTIASLFADRLEFSRVISTDVLRQLLREQFPVNTQPILHTSSYNSYAENIPNDNTNSRLIAGYERQNDLLFDSILSVIQYSLEVRRESIIIEGVHLSVDVIQRLLCHYSSSRVFLLPCLTFISNTTKHAERLAIRAKYMTIEPRLNKYLAHFDNIRCIQDHLCRQAEKVKIVKIDNTNLDQSLALLHYLLFSSYKKFLSSDARTLIDLIFESASDFLNYGSKEMLRLIRKKHLLLEDSCEQKTDPCFDPSAEGDVVSIIDDEDEFSEMT